MMHTLTTTTIVVHTTVFFLCVTTAGSTSCPSGWSLYSKEKVCIISVEPFKKCSVAIDYCKTLLRGNLVQIFDIQKNTFVQGIRKHPDFTHYIGVGDYDADTTKEYVNGSKYLNHIQGIRVAADYPGSSCGVQLVYNKGWGFQKDNSEYKSICERPLEESTKNEQTRCTSSKCDCLEDEWTYYSPDKTYIKVNKVFASYIESIKLCARMGATLVTILDQNKHKFLQGSKSLWASSWRAAYWVGIRYIYNDGRKWRWEDGSVLTDGSYTNWHESALEGWCATVIWDYDGKWRPTQCTANNMMVCQAEVPCAARLSVATNGTWTEEKATTVSVKIGQKVNILCKPRGFRRKNARFNVMCPWEIDASTVFDVIHASFTGSLDMHRKICECSMIISGGNTTTELLTVALDILHRPVLQEGEVGKVTQDAFGGYPVKVLFKIIANPKPHKENLTRQGSQLEIRDFDVIFEEYETMNYVVFVALMEFTPDQNGSFRLILSNGVEDTLALDFTLVGDYNAMRRRKRMMIALGAAFLLLLALVLGCCFYVYGRRREVASRVFPVAKDDDSSSSDTTTITSLTSRDSEERSLPKGSGATTTTTTGISSASTVTGRTKKSSSSWTTSGKSTPVDSNES